MRALLACVWVAAASVSAAREGPQLAVAPEVEVGAGYDDNLFLNPSLVGAPSGPVGDSILHVQPRILATLRAAGDSLSLGYDLVWHQPLSGRYGSITDHLVWLEYRTPEIETPLWPLVLRVAGLLERYDAPFTSLELTPGRVIEDYDAFWLPGAEVEATLVGRLGRGGASYRLGVRGYAHRDQQDLEQRAGVYYDRRLLPQLALGATYTYTHLGSSAGGAPDAIDGLGRHRFALPLRYAWPIAGLRIEPQVALQTLPAFTAPMLDSGRHDVLFGLGVAATLQVSEHFNLFGRYDVLYATSDDPTGVFSRNQFLLGVSAHLEVISQPALRSADDPLRLAPERLDDGRIRFRVRAPAAQSVALVGDWTGWDPAAGPMARSDDPKAASVWEIAAAVPPGRHTYSFLVDGQPVRPPEADAYVSDGFGSENGVLLVAP